MLNLYEECKKCGGLGRQIGIYNKDTKTFSSSECSECWGAGYTTTSEGRDVLDFLRLAIEKGWLVIKVQR